VKKSVVIADINEVGNSATSALFIMYSLLSDRPVQDWALEPKEPGPVKQEERRVNEDVINYGVPSQQQTTVAVTPALVVC